MRKLLAALLFALPLAAYAKGIGNTDWGKFEYDFEDEKPWVELQAQLPAYPKEENLLPLYVSAATDNKFFVDGASISVGGDGVIRYTLVARSSAGASNVSFEGIRCATQEQKPYAFGHADGTWSKAQFSKWQPIRYQDLNRQHHVLYDDFFCPDGIAVASPDAAIKALKRAFKP